MCLNLCHTSKQHKIHKSYPKIVELLELFGNSPYVKKECMLSVAIQQISEKWKIDMLKHSGFHTLTKEVSDKKLHNERQLYRFE